MSFKMYCYLFSLYLKGRLKFKDNRTTDRLLNKNYIYQKIVDFDGHFPIHDDYVYISDEGREFFENFNLKFAIPLLLSTLSLLVSITALVISILF